MEVKYYITEVLGSLFLPLVLEEALGILRLTRAAFQSMGNQQCCRMPHAVVGAGFVNPAVCWEGSGVLRGNAALSGDAEKALLERVSFVNFAEALMFRGQPPEDGCGVPHRRGAGTARCGQG